MNTFWDSRYDADHFVYGTQPNRFFASEIDKLSAGSILLPGEGEGRNAVYAASIGWVVDAFDQSRIASEKALGFASEKGVQINYRVCGIHEYEFKSEIYDVVALTFFHAAPAVREILHQEVTGSLKPGGLVILEAFHTSQLGRPSGGPQSLDLLFDTEKLIGDFRGLKTLLLETVTDILDEGTYHQGEASLIRYLGKNEF